MKSIGSPKSAEKQTVTGHRVVNAGPGENQSVVTSKGRDHDRSRHDDRTEGPEDMLHQSGADPVLRRVLNSLQRERDDVGEICRDVEYDDDQAADQQRARQILRWVFNLAGRECDVVPGGLGKQWPRHRPAQYEPKCENTADGRGRLDSLQIPSVH